MAFAINMLRAVILVIKIVNVGEVDGYNMGKYRIRLDGNGFYFSGRVCFSLNYCVLLY